MSAFCRITWIQQAYDRLLSFADDAHCSAACQTTAKPIRPGDLLPHGKNHQALKVQRKQFTTPWSAPVHFRAQGRAPTPRQADAASEKQNNRSRIMFYATLSRRQEGRGGE